MADFTIVGGMEDDTFAPNQPSGQSVKLKNFEFSEKNFLGEGNFAAVFKGKNIKTGEEVAIKRIVKKKIDIEPKLVQGMKTEVEIMTRQDVDHSHLIKLYHFQETSLFYYLVLELCRSDLGKIIKGRREKILGKNAPFSQMCPQPCLPEEVAGMFFVHLIFGLNSLHQRNLLHRDLKPENLLLMTNPLEKNPPAWDDCILKLADFGFSRHLGTDTMLAQTVCGTPLYMSPEIINGATYGKRSDIWSCGCILYEMLTGVPPFIAQSQNLLTQKISGGQVNYPPYISPEAQQCMYQLLRKNPQNRHEMEKVVKEPFFMKHLLLYKSKKEGPKKGLSTPTIQQQAESLPTKQEPSQSPTTPSKVSPPMSPGYPQMQQVYAFPQTGSPALQSPTSGARPLPKVPAKMFSPTSAAAAVGIAELNQEFLKLNEDEKKVVDKKMKLQQDIGQKLKK